MLASSSSRIRTPWQGLSLSAAILLVVGIALAAIQIPAMVFELWVERENIAAAAEQQADAALDMLEAVHIQSMLNRGRVSDNDPAIDTLNGSMDQFSRANADVRLWVFMAPRVVDYQRSQFRAEIEPPQDEVDRAVLADRRRQVVFDGDSLRVSRPVILGEGRAAHPKCAACHSSMMQVKQGELIGGYSAAVDLSHEWAVWRTYLFERVLVGILILGATLALIYVMLHRTALRPLQRLTCATDDISRGRLDTPIEGAERRDEIGSLARSLEVFRHALIVRERLEQEKEAATSQARFLTSHDALTGLPNRGLFVRTVEREVEATGSGTGSLTVLCIDVDHFKRVNDTLGFRFGDELLKRIAQMISAAVPEGTLVARLGADEFGVLLRLGGDDGALTDLCRALVAVSDRSIWIGAEEVHFGISIGGATAFADSRETEELIQFASLAAHRAIQDGGRLYRHFTPDLNAAMRDRHTLEQDLRAALDAGQLELHYQPVVDCTSEKLVAVEALMRWHHPSRGWVGPTTFIPIAEATGLIVPLGRWLLWTACSQARFWPELSVAINLSPIQFRQPDVVETVRACLAETGIEPSRLELEITEGVLLERTEEAMATVRALRALGVRIAMDDFGTGYSSLGYLRNFPFDTLKIDRSFVAALGDDPSAEAIIGAIIALARSLNMKTTAEGVETAAQRDFLQAAGCDHAQGFYYARPQPPLSITQKIASGTLREQGRARAPDSLTA